MEKKREILLQRGFAEEEINTEFRSILAKDGNKWNEWYITTITPEAVVAADMPEQLAPLFEMDSVLDRFANPHGTRYNQLNEFTNDIPLFTVSAAALEPYIARLVKAVNEIGAITTMSCDGWHKESRDARWNERTMKLYMNERYSVIWLWLIMEHVFGERWDRKLTDVVGKWLPYANDGGDASGIKINSLVCRMPRGEEQKIYERNHRYAVFIENHKEEFLEVRKSLVGFMLKNRKVIENMNFVNTRIFIEENFAYRLSRVGKR